MGQRTKNRREFLQLGIAAAALPLLPSGALAAVPAIKLTLEGLRFVTMPGNFTDLSYKMPQMYNPKFFSADNHALVDAFRNLSPHGVLRLGGNLSDVTRWKSDSGDFANDKQIAGIEHGKTYWEWKLTDLSVREHRDGAITPAAIHSLRTFLDATGRDLIYGYALVPDLQNVQPMRPHVSSTWSARSCWPSKSVTKMTFRGKSLVP